MATSRNVIEVPAGYASPEAGLFIAQLDDLSAMLAHDLEGIGADELEWQSAPGMNTVGMLLAHMAIVEVFWTDIGIHGKGLAEADINDALGIGMDGDGMPIPPDGRPPRNLAGKPLPYFLDLLAKGRSVVKLASVPVTDRDLSAMRTRTRKNGDVQEFNVRWVFYHLVEHFAGHYGQILLLRHQYRDATSAARSPGA